jgi:hypothetical protein
MPTNLLSAAADELLCGLEVLGSHLASLGVANDIKAELLAFDDVVHAGPLDRGDVDENVRSALIGLDEAEALGAVEPLYSTCRHDDSFQSIIVPSQRNAGGRLTSILKGKFVRGRDAPQQQKVG